LQNGGGSLIITGLFEVVGRFCGIDSINGINLRGFVRDCLRANDNLKGEA
jgi:hypothetical protein